ncbi:adenylyl-sulfate kinase [Methanococcoides burtonii]|uniref:Carbon monoxide dehydrogenase accessory protein n=1 Tax=Methanococcoides burtonii (strain DSM 6242 / NBRC 107633 / OCM 468 / ACE-M) TaxID=259564 RepID=Q12X05_METBU|nr:adenylyl-sulfate kinase [Methanococcoides burtonii]ABE52021.1 Carbon monoxide dehydrogenase accessory protein [Methanococcoides burtonii DSM 6242]
MKTLLCGKGGSGKSTLTALIAKSLSERGCNVLVIDNDESNFGLHMQMGLELPDDFLNFLGGKKNLVGKMMEAFPKGEKLSLFDHKWEISTIPEGYVTRKGNLSLIAVGKIHEFGEGCACPMGALAKQLIQNIELGENDFVLVDTEAGIEHFGRGVEEGCDVLFMVADPSYESIRLSEKISKLADNSGKPLYYILNRAEGASREILSCGISEDRVISTVPIYESIFKAGLLGDEFHIFVPEVKMVADFLIEHKSK